MRMTTLAVLALSVISGSALADSNSAYLAANAKKPGVHVTADGLQYKPLGRKGNSSQKPGATDCVTVNYKGTFIDGRVFDQSPPGQPISFPVNGVIPGWTEALKLMKTGDVWEIVIPAELGYGSEGAGNDIPPDQVLMFQLQLVKVEYAP